MGKTKRLQSPSKKQGGSDQSKIQNKLPQRRKSLLSLVSPKDVTEGSLEVWRHLPSNIRHDPSMVSFQQENDRLHGKHTVISKHFDVYVRHAQAYQCNDMGSIIFSIIFVLLLLLLLFGDNRPELDSNRF